MKKCKYCKGTGKSVIAIEMPLLTGLKNINRFSPCSHCWGKGVRNK
ncbi:hypothetical protein [Paenibacillus oralis]|nr:hypothetical protein [Paenibacillus oralis]